MGDDKAGGGPRIDGSMGDDNVGGGPRIDGGGNFRTRERKRKGWICGMENWILEK
jgi:hypothetical protein